MPKNNKKASVANDTTTETTALLSNEPIHDNNLTSAVDTLISSDTAPLDGVEDTNGLELADYGQNSEPTIHGKYEPSARTNIALTAEITKAKGIALNYGNQGQLGVTSAIAMLAADVLVMGCEELRSSNPGVEKLAGDFKFYLEGVKSEAANAANDTIDIYTQLRKAMTEILGDVAKDQVIKNLLPNAVRKAVLVGLGWAQFAWFERTRPGRINRTDRGQTFADGVKVDETKYARGIAIRESVYCPIEYAVFQKPIADGGGFERSTPQPAGYPKAKYPAAGQIETLFFLTDEVSVGLYAKHVLNVDNERIKYDAVGYVEGMKPAPRVTQGTQAESTTTATNGATVIKVEKPEDMSKRLTTEAILSGSGETTTGAALIAMFNVLRGDKAKVDMPFFGSLFVTATEAVSVFEEQFSTAESILKNDKGLETIEALVSLSEAIGDVVRWDVSGTKLEYRPSGKDWKDCIKFDFSEHKPNKIAAKA